MDKIKLAVGPATHHQKIQLPPEIGINMKIVAVYPMYLRTPAEINKKLNKHIHTRTEPSEPDTLKVGTPSP